MTAKTLMLTVAATALIGLPALAQDAAPAIDPALDVNGDGMFSYPELQAAYPDLTSDQFTALDTSGDGLLDADEVAAAAAAGTLPQMNG